MRAPVLARLFGVLLSAALCFPAGAAGWPHVVQKHDRCVNRLERSQQLIASFEAAVDRVRAMRSFAAGENAKKIERFLHSLETREDYLRNRFERARNMSDKLKVDIETK
ncbi:MAG: hypothetical protein GF410_01525, partial [Chitinivibrionales bacterium]|nr:hypothetical protein [Chitinivibrionales bacterium]